MSRLHNRARRSDQPLVHVIGRFPSYWGRIRRLAEVDKKFSDLCRDYADAVESYRYWQEQGESRALERAQDYATRAQDYATIVAELETEIFREITAGGRLATQR